MRQTLTVSTALIIGFILVLSPLVGMAAQRALTVDSLEKAYVSRVTALDAEIASTSKAMDARIAAMKDCTPKESFKCSSMNDPLWKELNKKKIDLEFERKATTPSYNLLKEALK